MLARGALISEVRNASTCKQRTLHAERARLYCIGGCAHRSGSRAAHAIQRPPAAGARPVGVA